MLLEIENLVKRYKGGVKANDGITFSLEKGDIFGLLGPNGAGKSTLVNQIVGLAAPTSGSIRIEGTDIVRDPDYARRVCSFQAQTQAPIAGLTALQAIELVGMVRGGKKEAVGARARQLIKEMEIEEWANKTGAAFSGGVRRIVAFCMAAVTPGSIVILDEPTNDIDPVRRRLLWNHIRDLGRGGSTVLLVTHNVLEAEKAVDRLAIIDRGRVMATGTPTDVKGKNGTHMRLEISLELGKKQSGYPQWAEKVMALHHRVNMQVANNAINNAILWAQELKNRQIIEEFALSPTNLEDAYIRIVGRMDVVENGEMN